MTFTLPKTDNLQCFDIQLEHSTGIVYAGQELRGRVTIMFGELVTIQRARIRFIGRARTSWSDDKYYQLPVKDRNIDHFMCHAEEVFFDAAVNLYGSSADNDSSGDGTGRRPIRRRDALPGAYEFPFRFQVPDDCPSTYEGALGSIRYMCIVSVSTKWKSDRQAKKPFTVIQPIDLNMLDVGTPVRNEQSERLPAACCLLRKVNEITMTVAMPKSGYVCGEHIPIWANVANNSNQKLKRIKATLLQRIRYVSKFHETVPRERIEYRTVAQVFTKEELAPRWGLVWDQESIQIPALPPTNDEHSDLIKIDYGLVYEAASMSMALPVLIGTIPLKSAAVELRDGGTNKFDISSDRCPTHLLPLPPLWKLYDGIFNPPQFCADDEGGPVSIRERADYEYAPGQLDYEPRYPYYGPNPDAPTSHDPSLEDDLDAQSIAVFQ